MEEEWKTIENYPNYKISNTGVVKNAKNKIIKQREKDGYYKLTLSDNNNPKDFFIHRLIAIQFIENPDNFKIVDHINGDKKNNNISNLKWTDHSGNTKNWHSHKTNHNKVIQYDLNHNVIKFWNSVSFSVSVK